jgi:putative transposase
MKNTRYTEEQMIRILGEVETGKAAAAVCRQYNVSEATIHRWRNKYRGIDQGSLRRLRELETENGRLKKIVAQQVMDLDAMKELVGKAW